MMLVDLAPELLLQIIGILPAGPDVLALRQVCKRLHQAAFPKFGETYFGTFDTDLSKASLERLEQVAAHEELRFSVRKLHVALRVDGDGKPTTSLLDDGLRWSRVERGSLDLSSPAVRSIGDLLSRRLVNVSAFQIEDELPVSRLHDENWADVADDADGPNIAPELRLSSTDLVTVLFLTLSTLPSVRIRSFRVKFEPNRPFRWPAVFKPGLCRSPEFQTPWAASLRDLELNWRLKQDESLPVALRLVASAENLQNLTLSWPFSEGANVFLERLANEEKLPRIRNLRLTKMRSISQTALFKLVSRFRDSLRSLDCSQLYLTEGSWSRFFTDMREASFPNLRCFTNWRCFESQGIGGENAEDESNRLLLCPLWDTPAVPGHGRFDLVDYPAYRNKQLRCCVGGARYEGTGMDVALKMLAESAYFLPRSRGPAEEDPPKFRSSKSGRFGVLRFKFEHRECFH